MPRPRRDSSGPWFLGPESSRQHPGGPNEPLHAPFGTTGEPASDPELVQALKRVMRQDHPLPLLMLASTMLDLFDPRNEDPFADDEATPADPPRDTFISSLEAVDVATTTGLMTAFAELTDDADLHDRLQRELEQRNHRLPHWLRELHPLEVIGTWRLSDVYADNDDLVVGVRTGSGATITMLGLVDHNLGAIITDLVVADEDPHDVLASIGDQPDHEDFRLERITPADARALLTDAIEAEARTWPSIETETWPGGRPLAEWLLRALPEGGTGHVHEEFDQHEQDELTTAFMTSPEAEQAGLEPSDEDVADYLTWFRTGYGNNDPHRWSPSSTEIFLLDWVPRKIMASVADLDRVPRVLRAHVRWGHRNAGIPRRLTSQTLAVVDDLEAEYRSIIRTPRHQGPMALLAAMGAIDDEPDPSMVDDRWGDDHWSPDEAVMQEVLGKDWLARLAQSMLPRLADEVGGEEALANLGTAPLPDEPLDLAGIPEDIRGRVSDVAALVTEGATALFGPEHATAGRRLLVDVAGADPAILRRRSSDDRLAAAVLWIVDHANSGWPTLSEVSVAELADWFGVKGSLAQRARTLLAAIDREPDDLRVSTLALGTPRYLTSTRRQWIAEQYRIATSLPHA